jgi:hypothetical protein
MEPVSPVNLRYLVRASARHPRQTPVIDPASHPRFPSQIFSKLHARRTDPNFLYFCFVSCESTLLASMGNLGRVKSDDSHISVRTCGNWSPHSVDPAQHAADEHLAWLDHGGQSFII